MAWFNTGIHHRSDKVFRNELHQMKLQNLHNKISILVNRKSIKIAILFHLWKITKKKHFGMTICHVYCSDIIAHIVAVCMVETDSCKFNEKSLKLNEFRFAAKISCTFIYILPKNAKILHKI